MLPVPFVDELVIDVDGFPITALVSGARPGAAPVVVAAHGITASSVSFARVAAELGDEVTLAALDLRGRGASGTHPGPFGMAAHGRDCVAVLDALGTEKGVLIGHSMGAYVATRAAADAPHRTTGLVLVDGGLPLALPDGTDPDTAIDALVGPAVARLALTWAGREELEAFWKAHPALGEWTTWHDAYVAYDVESDPDGALRSRVSETAVRHDGAELFTDPDSGRRVLGSDTPCWMLRAPRGLRDDPAAPLLGQDAIDTLKAARPDVEIVDLPPEVNHYSIVLGDTGARAVATAVREAIT